MSTQRNPIVEAPVHHVEFGGDTIVVEANESYGIIVVESGENYIYMDLADAIALPAELGELRSGQSLNYCAHCAISMTTYMDVDKVKGANPFRIRFGGDDATSLRGTREELDELVGAVTDCAKFLEE